MGRSEGKRSGSRSAAASPSIFNPPQRNKQQHFLRSSSQSSLLRSSSSSHADGIAGVLGNDLRRITPHPSPSSTQTEVHQQQTPAPSPPKNAAFNRSARRGEMADQGRAQQQQQKQHQHDVMNFSPSARGARAGEEQPTASMQLSSSPILLDRRSQGSLGEQGGYSTVTLHGPLNHSSLSMSVESAGPGPRQWIPPGPRPDSPSPLSMEVSPGPGACLSVLTASAAYPPSFSVLSATPPTLHMEPSPPSQSRTGSVSVSPHSALVPPPRSHLPQPVSAPLEKQMAARACQAEICWRVPTHIHPVNAAAEAASSQTCGGIFMQEPSGLRVFPPVDRERERGGASPAVGRDGFPPKGQNSNQSGQGQHVNGQVGGHIRGKQTRAESGSLCVQAAENETQSPPKAPRHVNRSLPGKDGGLTMGLVDRPACASTEGRESARTGPTYSDCSPSCGYTLSVDD